ncbi:sigma-54-dependent Fis family transcriptional regulator [Vibrio fortis]|uniref:Sigma-54-dependent Fis family transcriptional regulator n=1 Tax=Vibrio fortis TaxID=212667 RepID=A0A5N3SCT1_9VIBR|nr:sigma-54 dependent transcriptional regulator [Vibrio fortis]KAB0304142.1 sigma-54-dependent Fis family transcriptional regulator [Vibrio fortis]
MMQMSTEQKNRRCAAVLCHGNHSLLHGWVDSLRDDRWDIVNVNTMDALTDVLDTHKIPIAIVCLDEPITNATCQSLLMLRQRFSNLGLIGIFYDKPARNLSFIHHCFWDYFHHPIDAKWLAKSLGHLLGMIDGEPVKHHLTDREKRCRLIGDSKIIQDIKTQIDKVAHSTYPVLIQGETGTGKSLCARMIHNQSPRKHQPFVALNCGAIPHSLIHSELFGYEKGAFTGAAKRYIGHVERAQNGTLFLDEIGDLELPLQTYLLHFLENSHIERLGSNRQIPINCRVLFATNINLEQAVAAGRFRKDLYHRINVLNLEIPLLSEHREDIEALVHFELQKNDASHFVISNKTLDVLKQYQWPGNIRELFNAVKRAVVYADHSCLETQHMQLAFKEPQNDNSIEDELSEKRIRQTIEQQHYNISATARALDVSRTTLYKLLKRHRISY